MLKSWKKISLALLMALGGTGLAAHAQHSAHADTVPTTTQQKQNPAQQQNQQQQANTHKNTMNVQQNTAKNEAQANKMQQKLNNQPTNSGAVEKTGNFHIHTNKLSDYHGQALVNEGHAYWHALKYVNRQSPVLKNNHPFILRTHFNQLAKVRARQIANNYTTRKSTSHASIADIDATKLGYFDGYHQGHVHEVIGMGHYTNGQFHANDFLRRVQPLTNKFRYVSLGAYYKPSANAYTMVADFTNMTPKKMTHQAYKDSQHYLARFARRHNQDYYKGDNMVAPRHHKAPAKNDYVYTLPDSASAKPAPKSVASAAPTPAPVSMTPVSIVAPSSSATPSSSASAPVSSASAKPVSKAPIKAAPVQKKRATPKKRARAFKFVNGDMWDENRVPKQLKPYIHDPKNDGMSNKSDYGWSDPGNQSVNFTNSYFHLIWGTRPGMMNANGNNIAERWARYEHVPVSRKPSVGAIGSTTNHHYFGRRSGTYYRNYIGHSFIVERLLKGNKMLVVEQNVKGTHHMKGSGAHAGTTNDWTYEVLPQNLSNTRYSRPSTTNRRPHWNRNLN